MANRQALRELQTRLADRLQAARTNTSNAASWLAVQASGRNYLLPLEQSGEIFAWTGILRVPYARPWFWGVANLRGSLAGVVDLGALLGHPVERTEQSLNDVSLVSLNAALQINAALVIDRLMGLRGAQDLQLLDADTSSMVSDAWGTGGERYVDKAGEVWQALQLQALVQSPEFLSIRI